jgi:hypothetical protein
MKIKYIPSARQSDSHVSRLQVVVDQLEMLVSAFRERDVAGMGLGPRKLRPYARP